VGDFLAQFRTSHSDECIRSTPSWAAHSSRAVLRVIQTGGEACIAAHELFRRAVYTNLGQDVHVSRDTPKEGVGAGHRPARLTEGRPFMAPFCDPCKHAISSLHPARADRPPMAAYSVLPEACTATPSACTATPSATARRTTVAHGDRTAAPLVGTSEARGAGRLGQISSECTATVALS
jgi:hypothetical protein